MTITRTKKQVNGIILKEMTKDSLLQSCGIDNAFHRAVLVEKIRALFETGNVLFYSSSKYTCVSKGGKEMSKTESKISFPLVLLPVCTSVHKKRFPTLFV